MMGARDNPPIRGSACGFKLWCGAKKIYLFRIILRENRFTRFRIMR